MEMNTIVVNFFDKFYLCTHLLLLRLLIFIILSWLKHFVKNEDNPMIQ